MDLHILNGDSLAERFTLGGDRAVMREALIDGPLREVPDVEFECLRAEYLYEVYRDQMPTVTDPLTEYQSRVASEWHNALQTRAWRIYLWFDEDVFCQINTLFWLIWFARHEEWFEGRQLFYIRPQPEYFTDMERGDYAACLNDAMPVGGALLKPAQQCWAAIANQDFDALAKAKETIPPNHRALRRALSWYATHYKPHPKSGLPEIVHEIRKQFTRLPGMVDISKEEKFRLFSLKHKISGLGDAQFFHYLKLGETI